MKKEKNHSMMHYVHTFARPYRQRCYVLYRDDSSYRATFATRFQRFSSSREKTRNHSLGWGADYLANDGALKERKRAKERGRR